jgi:hypothetical protein
MKSNAIAIMTLAALGALGCSFITNFDEDLINGVDAGPPPYSLKDNIGDRIAVNVSENKQGTIVLNLKKALPTVDADENETIKILIEESTISLDVKNVETDTTVNLFNGEMVDHQPDGAGQYKVDIDDTRKTVTIAFYNEFDGKSLLFSRQYSALIAVDPNDFNLKVETFNVAVDLIADNDDADGGA